MQLLPPGDGISAGAPVQDSTGKRVGYLNHGANWIVCQASGATVHNGAYLNRWWGYTEADDHKWGWVNAIWGRGGDNDQGFAGVPNCHGSKGYPPAVTPPKPKPKPKPLPKNMVVLGDSYSAGEGADPNSGFSCFRSPKAYGWLVASAPGYRMTAFEACGGETTISVLNDQLSAVNASTTLVTMSVGGNDADFAGVLGRCAGGFGLVTGPCKNHDPYKSFHPNEAGYREDAKLVQAAL